MSFRSYLIFMTLATVCAWTAWVVVLHGVDPTRTGVLGFILFYGTLMMAVFGTITLLGLVFRLWRTPEELSSRLTIRSFRQGILLTALFTASLFLFSHGWFRWWTMMLLVVIVALVELTFLSTKRA